MTPEALERQSRERFWRRVLKTDGCWLWTGAVDKDGYGIFHYHYKKCRPHRVAFQWERGDYAGVIRHSCDTPACVRPSHLQSGSQKDNIADCISRNRFVYGDRNGRAKLSDEAITQIRASLSSGQSHRSIAKRYGVTHRVIGLVASGSRKTASDRVEPGL